LLKAPAESIDRRMKLRHILTVKNMGHKKLPALGAGSLSKRYMNISQQRPTRSALITAFDSSAKAFIIAENRFLEINS
jgi:hypothetical protein